MTLNAFDVRPTCDTADVQSILPFPPNPLKQCLVRRSLLPCWCALCNSGSVFGSGAGGNVNIVLDGTPQEEITHSQVRWPGWPVAAISLQHWFTLFPQDGSSDYRTIPNVTFTVCNRQEFHDLGDTSYWSYGVTKCSDNLYAPCITIHGPKIKHKI